MENGENRSVGCNPKRAVCGKNIALRRMVCNAMHDCCFLSATISVLSIRSGLRQMHARSWLDAAIRFLAS